MSTLPTTAARTAALNSQELKACAVLEIAAPRCANVYGVAPCTAAAGAGNQCYNTFATCQDKPNYVATTKVISFISRGVMSPPGMTLRPYLLDAVSSPTKMDMDAGLAPRGKVALTLEDEQDNDSSEDPYYATRATPAGGTYWGRWLARNKNYYGATAKLRKGFVASPWDWNLFLDEQYIVESFSVEGDGKIKVTLKDPLKFLENSTIPPATSGALLSDFLNIEQTDFVVAGSSTSVTLGVKASALDSTYNGMEVYISAGQGTGQRRVISAYIGASRVATVTAAWDVVPNTTSVYEVSRVAIALTAGRGVQYADPATSGKPEYVRIGKEIIRYTAKSGDTLIWTDATYRAQFGSTREDHKIGDSIMLCRAFIARTVVQVISDILIEGGVAAPLHSADLATECAAWLDFPTWTITACISSPENSAKLLSELLKDVGAAMWWDPQTQKAEFQVIAPRLDTYPTWDDESTIMRGSMVKKNMDEKRVTRAAISYAPRDAAAGEQDKNNYLITDIAVNQSAESVNEFGAITSHEDQSRWFGAGNAVAMQAVAMRRVVRLSAAPRLYTFKISHKDYTRPVGALIGIKSHKNVGVDGKESIDPCLITSLDDRLTHLEVQARSTNFSPRSAFIAPAGLPDYAAATADQRRYAFIANAAGKMSDGSDGYKII